jgi:hypothetical protein
MPSVTWALIKKLNDELQYFIRTSEPAANSQSQGQQNKHLVTHLDMHLDTHLDTHL